MEPEIVLNLHSDIPIYEQIHDQIRDQILSGKLAAGQSIPSMRSLAKLLRISVLTVQKAYENLRDEGYILSNVGRGTVVAEVSREQILETSRQEIESLLLEACQKAISAGISLEEMKSIMDLFYQEENE